MSRIILNGKEYIKLDDQYTVILINDLEYHLYRNKQGVMLVSEDGDMYVRATKKRVDDLVIVLGMFLAFLIIINIIGLF